MRIPKFILPVVSMLTACFIIGQSATKMTVKAPDFAYPETVDTQARAKLKQSLSENSGPGTVRALMDITLAQGAIDSDNLAGCLKLCDSVLTLPHSNLLTQSMIRMLKASVLNSIYTRQQWRFDRRQQPSEPLPTDYDEWSGEQFRTVIMELTAKAMTDVEMLASTPTKAWSQVLCTDRDILIYYPTLLDYMARMAIDMMQGWGNQPHIFSVNTVREACRPSAQQHIPVLKRDVVGQCILDLYGSVLTHSDIDSAPYINAILSRACWLTDHIASGNQIEDKKRFLTELYNSYLTPTGKPRCQWAGDILLEIPYDSGEQSMKEMYALYTAFLKDQPAYSRADCMRQRIDRLTAPSLQIMTPSAVEPGKETTMTVEMNNVRQAAIRIYDVSADNSVRDGYNLKAGQLPPLVGTVHVSASDVEIPFRMTSKATFTFPRPGCYIAVPLVDGKIRYNEYYQKIHATRIALSSSRYSGTKLWANDATDGKPMQNVSLTLNENPYRQNSRSITLGLTDSIGSLQLQKGSGLINAAIGKDRFAIGIYANDERFTPSDKWTFAAHGYPSLPVYHPGDTAVWVAICYEYKGGLGRPVKGRDITCIVTDAGGVSIDTLKLTTDNYGRIQGKTHLPAGSLTGRYNVRVENVWSTLGFQVSDYKLPTYRIDDVSAETDTPSAGSVTLRGRAMTYAGFPVSDARIIIDIKVSERYRWWSSQEYDLTTDSTETDSEGRFEIIVPADVTVASPLPDGTYRADIRVTSPSGETQTAFITWGNRSRYIIKAEAPATADLKKGVRVKATVSDYRDSTIIQPVTVELIARDSTVKERAEINGSATLATSGLQQGTYTLRFSSAQADTITQETILYDPAARTSPVEGQLLFIPEHEIVTDRHGAGELLLATDCPTHIRISVWTPDSMIYEKWHAVDEGFSHIPLSLPDDIIEATVSYQLTGRYRQESGNLKMRRSTIPALKIETETFRDRTTPGKREQWTLRITDQSGNGQQAAMIADLYNTALDALTVTTWQFAPRSGSQQRLRWNESGLSNTFSFYYTPPTAQRARYNCESLKQPDFNTYGREWMGHQLVRNMMMVRRVASKAMDTADSVDEVEAEEEVSMAVYDAAPAMGMADTGAAKMAVNGTMETEEEAVAEGSGEQLTDDRPDSYREAEIPLAFFMPELTTDKDGRVILQFTVPDANTTWGFRAVAWTDSLMTASLARNVTASKPVMVQPNLPRFIRTGDCLSIPATVMNAGDTKQEITTAIEIFDPATGKTIEKITRTDTIAAAGKSLVTTDVTAPYGMTFIGYRIKSGNGTYSDGEQALIPILPAATPVIETQPFYMAPDEKEYEMKLPRLKDESTVTLQFCENPAWYVVTALPGLIGSEATTAPEAARSIFSAAIACGLLKSYPQIAEALKMWTDGAHDDDMLTSMLERNADLKALLLSATPWMLDARNDNERMARLALLFDKATIDKALSDNIAILKKLQTKEGGWSWTARYRETSPWATRQVLGLIGRTAELGYMPEDPSLRKMITEALKWDTSQTLKQFSKHPDGDYTDYIELHDMYRRAGADAPDTRIADATTQLILRTWKKAPLALKARYARILNYNHYPNVAREIIASISQYGVSTPQTGMHFPSAGNTGEDEIPATALILQAIHDVDASNPAIDPIRQWLIMQKGLQNWGDGTTATSAIAAILTTSPRWIDAAKGSTIRLGNIHAAVSAADRLTGETEITASGKDVSGKRLTIKRESDTPAWGAVYTRFIESADSVTPKPCEGLSIEKALLTGDGKTLTAAGTLHTGDKVTVRLTIKSTNDLDYVVITDDRASCLEPVGQLSGMLSVDGLVFYRENRDSQTRIFIDRLPRGTYVLTYPMWVNNSGECISGIATIQSQYAPRYTAHSGGTRLSIR